MSSFKEKKEREYCGSAGESEETRTYPPLASGVDDAITKNQTTRTTHEIPAAKFLDDIRVRISAVGTDEANGKIGTIIGLELRGRFALGEWERLRICH
jgi:hypothetical protein